MGRLLTLPTDSPPSAFLVDDSGNFLTDDLPGSSTPVTLSGVGNFSALAKQKMKASTRLVGTSTTSAKDNSVRLNANAIINAIVISISVPLLGINASAVLFNRTLDNGLRSLADEADKILICSSHPITYGQAVSFSLGEKNFGTPGGAFGPIFIGVNGRKVASTAITDGALTVAGIGTHWAAVDSAASRLLATGQFDTARLTFAGVPFALPSFEVTLTGS